METIELCEGVELPVLGFGVYQIKDASECKKAVLDAIEAGYRAIDTAASYGNEKAVGEALAECGVPRHELFITTKLWVEDASENRARTAVERSLELLGLDYLDLYLIHQPVGDVYGAWRTMQELHAAGTLHAIGVSNFPADRVTDFALANDIRPMVNQIEINPFCQQKAAIPENDALGIVTEAWAPFAEGRSGLFTNPVLQTIASAHRKTVAQVVLRWLTQTGHPVVSKSVRPERMRENLASLDFVLSEADLAAIAALDAGKSQFFSHQDPEIIRWFHSRHIEH